MNIEPMTKSMIVVAMCMLVSLCFAHADEASRDDEPSRTPSFSKDVLISIFSCTESAVESELVLPEIQTFPGESYKFDIHEGAWVPDMPTRQILVVTTNDLTRTDGIADCWITLVDLESMERVSPVVRIAGDYASATPLVNRDGVPVALLLFQSRMRQANLTQSAEVLTFDAKGSMEKTPLWAISDSDTVLGDLEGMDLLVRKMTNDMIVRLFLWDPDTTSFRDIKTRGHPSFPFDTAKAKRLQEDTSKAFGVPVELTVDLPNDVKMPFMLIPAGEFVWDEVPCFSGEKIIEDRGRQRRIRITRPFYIAKYPCTQAQWKAVMGSPHDSLFTYDSRLPVERVSWEELHDAFLPAIESYAPQGMRFRLPSEAQWEHACRAGTSTLHYFGDTITPEQVNYKEHSHNDNPDKDFVRGTTVVGKFPANPWGLHDMHGNVMEWCRDWYNWEDFAEGSMNDPENTKPEMRRSLRGGAWYHEHHSCRSSFRGGDYPNLHRNSYGFRLILEFSNEADGSSSEPSTPTSE